ncbi:unnamed protein product [Schistocephalus solidus]|uniref:Glycoprotein n=1 Tax=Schistocephalus solidus TaxID=70667 RepID=A0A183T306_SCHSO|nr:unnamed protein product [Schistocephalus solidus]
MPVYLLLLALVMALMFSGTYLATEGCHYLMNKGGFEKTDYIANTFIEMLWLNVTAGLKNCSGSLTNYLQLPAPQNILAALNNKCDPKNINLNGRGFGVMGALGWSSVFNVTNYLQSNHFQNIIDKRESWLIDVYNEHSKEVEGGIDLTQFDIWEEDLKNFYGNADPQIEDGKRLLENMTEAMENLEPILTYHLERSIDLKNAVLSLNASKKAYQEVLYKIDAMYISAKAAYEPVAIQRSIGNLKVSINDTIRMITGGTLRSVLQHSYRKAAKRIEIRLENEVGGMIADITQTSFPCQKASYAWKAVAGTVCDSSGIVPQFVGLGLLIALETLLLCLFYAGLFYFSRIHYFIVG